MAGFFFGGVVNSIDWCDACEYRVLDSAPVDAILSNIQDNISELKRVLKISSHKQGDD